MAAIANAIQRGITMDRDLREIIDDFREIIKPKIGGMLLKANFEGQGESDKAEFEHEIELILEAAENFRWIRTYERLPEQCQSVIVAWIDPRKPIDAQYICYDEAIYQMSSFCGYGLSTKKILAWMPIPKLHLND